MDVEPQVVRRVEPGDGVAPRPGRWPDDVPAIAQLLLAGLDLQPGVTFLVGENSSGKSTIVEAVAEAFGLNVEGGTRHASHISAAQDRSDLVERIRLVRVAGSTRWGHDLATCHSQDGCGFGDPSGPSSCPPVRGPAGMGHSRRRVPQTGGRRTRRAQGKRPHSRRTAPFSRWTDPCHWRRRCRLPDASVRIVTITLRPGHPGPNRHPRWPAAWSPRRCPVL